MREVCVAVLFAVLLVSISGMYLFGIPKRMFKNAALGVLFVAPAVVIFSSLAATATDETMEGAGYTACFVTLGVYGSAAGLMDEESIAAYWCGWVIFLGVPGALALFCFGFA